jgi:hypothetical protein
MTEEKAHADAEALASALGIVFYVVRSEEDSFAAVQLPSEGSEIVAAIEPPGEKRSFDGMTGFGELSAED